MFVLAVFHRNKSNSTILKRGGQMENFPARFSPYLSVAFNLYL